MRFKLPLVPEAPATVSTGKLLQSEMHAEVVLHGQTVWVSGVTHVAVILANLVQILVVCQTAGMTVSASTLVAGEGAPAASVIHLLSSCPSIRLLVALWLAVTGGHLWILHFRVPHPHGLHLGWPPLITCTVVLVHALDSLVPDPSLGSVLFV